jgi:hypothetical protein
MPVTRDKSTTSGSGRMGIDVAPEPGDRAAAANEQEGGEGEQAPAYESDSVPRRRGTPVADAVGPRQQVPLIWGPDR